MARANAFKETTKREIREEVADIGVTAGLMLGAMLALAATCVIALIALYMWLAPQYGQFAALATVGGLTALASLALGFMAASRSPPASQPVVTPTPLVTPKPAARPPLNTTAAAMVAPPPADASLVDILAHRVSSRAAGAADEAIDVAEDAIANGSRTALVGTLAATVFVGLIIGRRGGI